MVAVRYFLVFALVVFLALGEVECLRKKKATKGKGKKPPKKSKSKTKPTPGAPSGQCPLDQKFTELGNTISNIIGTEIDEVQATDLAEIKSRLVTIRVQNEEQGTKMASLQDKMDDVLRKLLDNAIHQPKDCFDIKLRGLTTSGMYTIYVTNLTSVIPIQVYCDQDTDGGGWLVLQRRENGLTPFNRNWVEYKNGFGDKESEFWLGNDNIHLITQQRRYEIRFDLWDRSDAYAYATYQDVTVAGEDAFYRLDFSGGSYAGNAGDGLDYSPSQTNNGRGFTTMDEDHDGNSGWNCATLNSGDGGWWYSNCGYVRLNGDYNSIDSTQGISWREWLKTWGSLNRTEIKLRPID